MLNQQVFSMQVQWLFLSFINTYSGRCCTVEAAQNVAMCTLLSERQDKLHEGQDLQQARISTVAHDELRYEQGM
jgi:hypothetical protein